MYLKTMVSLPQYLTWYFKHRLFNIFLSTEKCFLYYHIPLSVIIKLMSLLNDWLWTESTFLRYGIDVYKKHQRLLYRIDSVKACIYLLQD